nr:immunoglobulin heavy chain junction region [Macaca mulatta]MOW23715.1 immunoglobulin heavy chain junction region [Macaca mulatta]MOW23795.1 immunoglobulin heavy chain junction region [Macaca mulatta]MOW24144.1 immunoglobulin heavy chain junction region [Macaca mulatta]MOW25520.1 immunoglobulin heavy chain junction region [Macaca mulatta]
CTGRKGGDDFW